MTPTEQTLNGYQPPNGFGPDKIADGVAHLLGDTALGLIRIPSPYADFDGVGYAGAEKRMAALIHQEPGGSYQITARRELPPGQELSQEALDMAILASMGLDLTQPELTPTG